MFINKANIKLYAAALFSALIASSCLNLDETQDGAYGYLTISGVDVDVNVSELVPTKAGSTVDISGVRNYADPQLGSASVKVTDSKGTEHDWTGAQLTLPLGAYTVTATYGLNGFDAPYFVGTASGTISNTPSTATVKFTLANSVMAVTNTIPEHYTPAASDPVKISLTGDASERVSVPMDTYVFVPSGEALKVEVKGSSTAGVDKTFSYTMSSSTEARKAYNVQITDGGASMHKVNLSKDQVAWGDMIIITTPATFEGISDANQANVVYEAVPVASADWSGAVSASADGVISGLTPDTSYYVRARVGGVASEPVTLTPTVTGISVSAAHTDTNGAADGGDLDGTDVAVTFASPHSEVTKAISSWSFEVKSTDGENAASRTFSFAQGTVSGTANSDGSTLTGANDWPYLPQGNYTLIATATLENDTELSSMATFEVPAPVFGVSVSGYTTYDKYLEYKETGNTDAFDAANKEGYAEYIFQISSSVGISEALLKNTNYGTTKVYYSCGPYENVEYVFVNGEGDTDTTLNKHNIGDVSGFSWGENTLKARIVFAGTEMTSSRPCHITGLPYSYDFVDGSLDKYKENGWSLNGKLRVSSESLNGRAKTLVLQHQRLSSSGEKGFVVSPKFEVPLNSSISVQPSIHRSSYDSNGSHSREGYVGAVANTTTSNTSSIVYTTNGSSNTAGSISGQDIWMSEFDISSDTPYVSVDCNAITSYKTGAYYFLHEVHLRYAQLTTNSQSVSHYPPK